MAEPANTPVPASTPRSASPAPGAGPAGGHHHHHQHHLLPFSLPILSSSSSSASQPQPTSHGAKPRVLHLGDPVRYNPGTYVDLASRCDVVRPPAEDRQRPAFLQGLREGRWGDFQAVLRPSWGSGGEMGRWDAELVAALPPSVRVFASAGAGYDWVDTDLLADKGIIYCNGGTAAADAVADFALAMIISTFRHLPWCAAAASSPDPRDFAACHLDAPARSHNLRGKAVGIVGLGSVGRQVAARCAHGFGMRVGFHDVAPVQDNVVSGLGSDVVSHANLGSLLAASDCVVLCCPAAADGRPLITREALASVRRGARLVNVARGSLVDEDALADALAEGTLSSVALDVFADESRGAGDKLRHWAASGRALLSCHNAGGTVETHAGFEELSIRNVLDVLGGGKGLTPVNLQHLR